MKIFQDRLKEMRLACHLTQRQMAERLGISQPSYVRYEVGTSEPTLENLTKIAEISDVSVDFLLGRKEF